MTENTIHNMVLKYQELYLATGIISIVEGLIRIFHLLIQRIELALFIKLV